MDPDITTQVNVKKILFYYCCQVCYISIDLLFLLLFYVLQTGISPLHLSAKEGHVELCEHLVENGAMPGLTTNVRHKLLYCYYFFIFSNRIREKEKEFVISLIPFLTNPAEHLSFPTLKIFMSKHC